MRRLIVAMLGPLLAVVSHAAAVSGQGTWETTLLARDLDGDNTTAEAYFDTVLNITWLADANYSQTSGYDADGLMTWADANAWADSLTLGGYTSWRLADTVDVGNDGCNVSNSGTDCGYNVDTSTGEMASLFYDTLSNLAYVDTTGFFPQPGWGLTNTGPFSNFLPHHYWSATDYAPNSTSAWHFTFATGFQSSINKSSTFYAWAVHDGDIGTTVVPAPAAAWLFMFALAGLAGIRAKNR